ncbi:hypothetical protein TEA_004991 [Camellia sinensis var. sinensis]|uniref:Uncharacterized protein n=1 Tax=Camellia sinensis var. sinensis TaxID=542762 RepID=A0A4S4EFL7_CAMSN|nr:hypothetical protein TEA_004991 [Camellia sinensis var. sinensis]
MKIKSYHLRFSFVLLLMISLHFCICGAASAKKSNSMISGECNATIAECLADEGEGKEVFLMESETTRRFLAYNKDRLSLRALLRPPVSLNRDLKYVTQLYTPIASCPSITTLGLVPPLIDAVAVPNRVELLKPQSQSQSQSRDSWDIVSDLEHVEWEI